MNVVFIYSFRATPLGVETTLRILLRKVVCISLLVDLPSVTL